MSNYIQDPNDSKKQIPGPPSYQAHDRTSAPARCSFIKTPNYVLITKAMTKPFGFFYGTSASFSAENQKAGGSMNSSSHYDSDWGILTVGTKLDIHPTAWSGSATDNGQIKFVYRGGLDGSGRP